MNANPCARQAIRSIREQLQVQIKRVYEQPYSQDERIIQTLADELTRLTEIAGRSRMEFENSITRLDPFSPEYERIEQLLPVLSAYTIRAERTLAALPMKYLRVKVKVGGTTVTNEEN